MAQKESFFDLIYGPEKEMISDFFPASKLEAWLHSDTRAPLEPWVTPEYKATRDKIFKESSYRGPLMWYRARFGKHVGCDEEANEGLDVRIRVPTAFVRSKETVLSWRDFDERTGRFAGEFDVVEVQGGHGHWVQLEAAEEINGVLERFIKKAEGKEEV
jgi:pimeloyl-ACP methyl ester carboxylesterase